MAQNRQSTRLVAGPAGSSTFPEAQAAVSTPASLSAQPYFKQWKRLVVVPGACLELRCTGSVVARWGCRSSRTSSLLHPSRSNSLWVAVIAFALLLAVHLYYAGVLASWLDAPRLDDIPNGVGIWRDVFARLYRARRTTELNERQEKRFDRLISALDVYKEGQDLKEFRIRTEEPLKASA